MRRACRGYGSPQTAYAIECLMDDTARVLGMDPLDFRLKNTGRNGDISPLNGKPVATLGISDCLEEAVNGSVGRTQGRLQSLQ